jgi:RES domain-containing protein
MTDRLQIYRVDLEAFVPTAKSGEGARLYGGRWNSPGLPVIYCAQSLALAVLEILVHASTPQERADARVWFALSLPPGAVTTVRMRSLPHGWNDPVSIHPSTMALGDTWLRSNKSLALCVPSALLPGEWNYVLNVNHPHFRKSLRWSKPHAVQLDPRLVNGSRAD